MLIINILFFGILAIVNADSSVIVDKVAVPVAEPKTAELKELNELLTPCMADCSKKYLNPELVNMRKEFGVCSQACNQYIVILKDFKGDKLSECRRECKIVGCHLGCGYAQKAVEAARTDVPVPNEFIPNNQVVAEPVAEIIKPISSNGFQPDLKLMRPVVVKPAILIDPLETGAGDNKPTSDLINPFDMDPFGAAVSHENNKDDDDDNTSSSEEDKNDQLEEEKNKIFNLDWFKPNLLIHGEPQVDDSKPQVIVVDNEPAEQFSVPGKFFDILQTDRWADSFFDRFEPLMQKVKSLAGTGQGMIYTMETQEDGKIKTVLQKLDHEGNVISTETGDSPLIGGSNWKGMIPMSIKDMSVDASGESGLLDVPPEYDPRRYRVCMPMQLHWSTLCHDMNNLFNCASIRLGLPRWVVLFVVLMTSFFLIWMGVYVLSMAKRAQKKQRLLRQQNDYLPLYKDIDFSVETRIEAPAGPLPVKQPLNI